MRYLFLHLCALFCFTSFAQKKIVILGSSTAAGTGAGYPWVAQYTDYVKSINPANQIINLAQGGFTSWHIMPTGSTPRGLYTLPYPEPTRNITAAIAQNPDAIIINLPSNDAGYSNPATYTMMNYRDIVATAVASNIPVWLTTAGPRGQDLGFFLVLKQIKDSTLNEYGNKAIDVWTTLENESIVNIAAPYAFGDNVHYNQAGHDLIFQRVKQANVLNMLNNSALFYPKSTATDLSQPNDWTTDPLGGIGSSPVNFTSANQEFLLNGSGDHRLNGNLTLTGGSHITISNGNLKIGPLARLTIGAGSTFNFNGRPVTILSSSAGTGSIGITAGSIIGASNVTVERYIGPGPTGSPKRAWRLLTVPLTSAGAPTIYRSWQETGNSIAGYGTHITGGSASSGFDQGSSANASILQYNNISNTLSGLANTNATSIASQPGFFVFVRGDRTINLAQGGGAAPNETILRATGNLKQGNQPAITVPATNFSVVGNPYPSPIDWALIAAGDRSNIANRFYVWDPKLGGPSGTGGYVLFDAIVGFLPNVSGGSYTNTPNTLIQSGQALLVSSANGTTSGSLVFREMVKASTQQQVFRNTNGQDNILGARLMSVQNGVSVPVDGVFAVFSDNGNSAVTAEDAPKVRNFTTNFSIIRDNILLALEKRPSIISNDTIFFRMEGVTVGNYEIALSPLDFPPNIVAFIEDSYLGTSTPLNLQVSTAYNFNVTTDLGSSFMDRLRIVFKPATVLPVSFTNITAVKKFKTIEVKWSVDMQVDTRSYQVERSIDGTRFEKVGTIQSLPNLNGAANYFWIDSFPVSGFNYYRVKALAFDNGMKYSMVVKVNAEENSNSLLIYPNPAKNKQVTIQLTNQPKGVYSVRLLNTVGEMLYKTSIDYIGGSSAQTINLPATLSNGLYRMLISNGDISSTRQIIVE